MKKQRGVIFLYHGSAGPEWAGATSALAESIVRDMPGILAQTACLKEFSPDIMEAAERLASQGVEEALVVPMFIAPGGHAQKDIPQLKAALQQRFPAVRFEWAEVSGMWEEALKAAVAGTRERLSRLQA